MTDQPTETTVSIDAETATIGSVAALINVNDVLVMVLALAKVMIDIFPQVGPMMEMYCDILSEQVGGTTTVRFIGLDEEDEDADDDLT